MLFVVLVALGLGCTPARWAAGATTTTSTSAASSPSTTAGGSTATTATAPSRATGGGCEKIVTFGTSRLSVRFGGRRRLVLVHVPRSYTATIRVPLVLNLHGSGSTAADQEQQSGMDAESEVGGFIVAYPQAAIPSGSGFDWDIPGEPLPLGVHQPKNPPDDLLFLSQLVAHLEASYCIAHGAVFATGFSGGARMTSVLACDDSNIFAAVAPVAGLRWPDPCPTIRAVSVLAIHGTADHVDPYSGHGQRYWTESVPEALSDWAHQDDCRAPADVRRLTATLRVSAYLCPGHAVVELYTIVGGGHAWPGGSSAGAGASKLDADSLIWSFFSAHSIR